MRPLLTALSLLLAANVAGADRLTETEALRLLEKGIGVYEKADFPTARRLFQAAQVLAPEKANPYRWLGLAEARLDNCAEAVKAFDTFLLLARARDERTEEASREREQCQAKLPPPLGTLSVDSDPAGAKVEIDGRAAGKTPLRDERVAVGNRQVRLTLDAHASETVDVEVTAARVARLQVSLRRDGSSAGASGHRRWWVWTLLGVVVVGAAVGLTLGLTLDHQGSEATFAPVQVLP